MTYSSIWHAMKMFCIHYCECSKCWQLTKYGKKYTEEHKNVRIERMVETRKQNGSYFVSEETKQKHSKTVKELFATEKLTIWNKNIKAESDERMKQLHIKSAETQKKLYGSGKLVSWNDGLTKDDDARLKKHSEFMSSDKSPCKKPESRRKQREAKIRIIEKQFSSGMPIHPCIGLTETEILNRLEDALCIEIKRQYRVSGYYIDGYNSERNLAIEVDEPRHYNKDGSLKCKDKIRQQEIEKELKCSFYRIPYSS